MLGRSLFERLGLLGHKKHLLNMQYRMHPSISVFPNLSFYDRKILDGPNMTQTRHEHSYLPGAMFGSYSFINIDGREDRGRSKRNMAEVAAILEILRSLKQGASAWRERYYYFTEFFSEHLHAVWFTVQLVSARGRWSAWASYARTPRRWRRFRPR